jgi:ferritin
MLPKSLLSAGMKKGLQDALQVELYQSNLWKHLANNLQRLGLFGSQKYFEN